MSLVRADNRPLASRLKSALRTKYGSSTAMSETSALLLDISYSMDERLPNGKRKIDELRTLAAEFSDTRRFTFSSSCSELAAHEQVPDVCGGTAMHVAFLKVKSAGIQHIVLITDGEPDSEVAALQAASGLRIDVFYVGPDPAPPFLKSLADRTGGSYGAASLERASMLTTQVRERLMLTGGAEKGAIAL